MFYLLNVQLHPFTRPEVIATGYQQKRIATLSKLVDFCV